MIHFNVPPFIDTSLSYMENAIQSHKICGDGKYTKLCNEWIEKKFSAHKALLTTSGSSALDMAALLCDVKAGDEVFRASHSHQQLMHSHSEEQDSYSLIFARIQ